MYMDPVVNSIQFKVVNWVDQIWYRNTFTCLNMVLTIDENVYEIKTQALRSKELSKA